MRHPRKKATQKRDARKRTRKHPSISFDRIIWRDATFDGDGDKPHETAICWTAGVIIEATKEHVVIASEGFDDGTYRSKTIIPLGMVIRREHLKMASTPEFGCL